MKRPAITFSLTFWAAGGAVIMVSVHPKQNGFGFTSHGTYVFALFALLFRVCNKICLQ